MIAATEILCPACVDPDEGPARMLAECGVCDRCGDVFLRNASGDF